MLTPHAPIIPAPPERRCSTERAMTRRSRRCKLKFVMLGVHDVPNARIMFNAFNSLALSPKRGSPLRSELNTARTAPATTTSLIATRTVTSAKKNATKQLVAKEKVIRSELRLIPNLPTAVSFNPTSAAATMAQRRRKMQLLPETPLVAFLAAVPERTLDAPGLIDDYYSQCLDWSKFDMLAVALDCEVFLWKSGRVSSLSFKSCSTMFSQIDDYATALEYSPCGEKLLVGTHHGSLSIHDIRSTRHYANCAHASLVNAASNPSQHPLAIVHKQRTVAFLSAEDDGELFTGHRVSCVSWNRITPTLVAAGYSNGKISLWDTRTPRRRLTSGPDCVVFNLPQAKHLPTRHRASDPVCGVRFAPDGIQLATGGHDHVLCTWDTRNLASPSNLFDGHIGAVRALAWAPTQRNVLASGGGNADRHVRLWDTFAAAPLRSANANAQVTSLAFVGDSRIISAHGFSTNHLAEWDFPFLEPRWRSANNLHTKRILHMSLSPSQTHIATAAADETLKIWRVAKSPEKDTGNVSHLLSPSVLPRTQLHLRSCRNAIR